MSIKGKMQVMIQSSYSVESDKAMYTGYVYIVAMPPTCVVLSAKPCHLCNTSSVTDTQIRSYMPNKRIYGTLA